LDASLRVACRDNEKFNDDAMETWKKAFGMEEVRHTNKAIDVCLVQLASEPWDWEDAMW